MNWREFAAIIIVAILFDYTVTNLARAYIISCALRAGKSAKEIDELFSKT